MRFLFWTGLAALLFSCGEEQKSSSSISEDKEEKPDSAFRSYTMQFRYTGLPLIYHACGENTLPFERFQPSHFPGEKENSFTYCTFKTNGKYVALISCLAADCMIPVLTTYDRKGHLIDQESLIIAGCGADCGFSCTEFMTIEKDFSIYISDSVTTEKCDSMGYIVPGTKETYLLYRKGRLLPNGKIELSEETKRFY